MYQDKFFKGWMLRGCIWEIEEMKGVKKPTNKQKNKIDKQTNKKEKKKTFHYP